MIKSDVISKLNIDFLKGRIIDVIPITYDDDTGSIWEQDIDFQLESGTIINISDNDVGCKKEDIGQEKRIQMMTALRMSIEKCQSHTSEIGIFLNPDNPDYSPIICGMIKKMIEPSEEKYKQFRRYATLDIGIGQILLVLFKDHKEDFSVFHEGDCVVIKGGGLTVLQVV